MMFVFLRTEALCLFLICFGAVISWYEDEQKPTYLTANVGEHVVFNCEIDFPQDIPIVYNLKWNKDGESVFYWSEGTLTAKEPFTGRINLVDSEGYGKASVNLTSIRESDTGWYQCRVIFPNRNPSSRNNGTWFYLTVNAGNLLEIPPINQTTHEGEEAKFACITKDKDSTVVWYKDGEPIEELSNLKSRSSVLDDGTLIIRSTSMHDLGEYECEVISWSGEKQTARAFLDVQFKAKVVYAPKEIYLPFGKPAVLDCHFRANPPLTNLRWTKDGFLFDAYNVQGVFYYQNGSLLFNNVDDTHNGLYSCTPSNDLGTDGPSPPIRVIVQKAPIFITTPSNSYMKKIGETLEMSCDARDGNSAHKPTIIWYRKDGFPLPDERHKIEGGNLTLTDIQEDDRGEYICSAYNEAGTILIETNLIIENTLPKAPYNLSANSTHNSITLKWMTGYKTPDLEYSVLYRSINSTEWQTVKLDSKKNMEVTVSNLDSGREYEFMVMSHDKSDGRFSKTIRIKTKGSEYYDSAEEIKGSFEPIGAPKNVSIHLTMDGYLVTWEPPDFGKNSVRVYIVRWSEGPLEHLVGTVETKDLFLNVKNLEEDTTYYFQVSALSMDDYQTTSDKVVLMVPAYQKIRAISMGIMGAVALLGTIFAAFYYARKKCFKPYDDTKPHMAKEGNIS